MAPKSAPNYGALREIVVSDDHARLARSLRDCVTFSTALRAYECNHARRIAAKEGDDSRRPWPLQVSAGVRQSFSSDEHLRPQGMNAR